MTILFRLCYVRVRKHGTIENFFSRCGNGNDARLIELDVKLCPHSFLPSPIRDWNELILGNVDSNCTSSTKPFLRFSFWNERILFLKRILFIQWLTCQIFSEEKIFNLRFNIFAHEICICCRLILTRCKWKFYFYLEIF